MASEQNESEGDDIVELRRSCRTKRNREEWEETLHMKVRRNRASGDSATVAVVSLGGKPSHMKKSRIVQTNAVQAQAAPTNMRLSFCGGCGNRHQHEDNFCRSCGQKRGWASGAEAPVNIVSPTKEKQAKVKTGRKYKKQFLRCGWQIVGGNYIAPDGKAFESRKLASKYSNNSVSKLEPERKDGWEVYTNESGSHVDWIAPDGTKLFSFASASAFAKSSSQPLFGRDGITKKIQSFFVTQATTSNPTKSTLKPAQAISTSTKAQATTSKTKTVQEAKVSKKKRVFTVPKQSESGANLQRLCRLHATSRAQARKIKLEQEIAQFTIPRSIKNRMANKVILTLKLRLVFNYIIVCDCCVDL